MELQNLLFHKKNTAVSVNGHIYKIAHDLVIRDEEGKAVDVPQADGELLLANKTAWRLANAPKPDRSAHKGTIKLITATGEVIPPPSRLDDVTKPAIEVSATIAAVDQFEAKKRGEVDDGKDPVIPKGNAEWADPKASYSLNWLRACAKAYKVKYVGKDKASLVAKIKEAMYE